MQEEKTIPTEEEARGPGVEQEEGDFEVVAGTRVGHGGLPLFLVVCFVLIVIWAIFSWINPVGK